ncbi:hypothetical protein HYO05_23050 [Vibrio parahaemolyticus]|uniref:hypothetical protein n=1 Tax=Vibrio parahaemolyticus TaxID=670 RepID=UPI00084A7A39|nr:hypothetical protein [Vibrio parahaemolyticus]EGQ8047253.1 hypothetical protein [Vibrio parahaemolyticus]EHH2867139.1 hypothetical protein [Vibrio parahaemolyticus]ELA9316696.1 hypothetical protein [Vibrio parahaemolyticus]MBM5036972.1 hypothetical protein [Vibrio parahaemolyticus]MBM5050645.1 hypothetical protein [Vibrio parahaemolyticus]
MYIWNIKSLKEQIRSGRLTEKDRFIYMFLTLIFTVLGIELALRIPIESGNVWDTISSVSSVLIPILGTLLAYKANGADNGTDFLGRYFSISFVVTVRFFALLIPMFALLFAYYMLVIPENPALVSTALDTLPFIAWQGLLYYQIVKHVGAVKHS